MIDAMLSVVDAISEQERTFFRESWKPDGTRLFINTLDTLVSLSQDECIFEDLEVVLQALGEQDEPGDVEDEEEEVVVDENQEAPNVSSVQATQ
jgi:hypothetical protein